LIKQELLEFNKNNYKYEIIKNKEREREIIQILNMSGVEKKKSSLFSDATLDPVTQRYIHSKCKLAEGDQDFEKIDLRNMCENVR